MTDRDVEAAFRHLREQNLLDPVMFVVRDVTRLLQQQLLGQLAATPALDPATLGSFVYQQGKLAALHQILTLFDSVGRIDDPRG